MPEDKSQLPDNVTLIPFLAVAVIVYGPVPAGTLLVLVPVKVDPFQVALITVPSEMVPPFAPDAVTVMEY